MRRFFRLVKNEYIKNLKLVSTWVMLILTAVAAIGLPALARLSYYIDVEMSQGDMSGYDWPIADQLNSMMYSAEGTSDKYYIDIMNDLINSGAKSTYDWRFSVTENLFYSAWDKADEQVYEEYTEYMTTLPSWDEENYTLTDPEDAQKASEFLKGRMDETFKAVWKTDEYAKPMAAILSNDMKAYYQLNIDEANSRLSAAVTEYDKQIAELDVWYYTYLRDNDVYKCTAEDYMYDFLKDYLPQYYDADYQNATELYYVKKNIITYENADKGSPDQISIGEYKTAVNKYAVYNYMTENHIETNVADEESDTLWMPFKASVALVTFIGILVVVIAAHSVASEFSNGTIKFLLINPVKRWKILVSKYFTVLSMGYIMIAITFVISLLTSMILFGADDIGAMYITASGGEVSAVNGILYMAKNYLLASTSVVVMATMAFAISVLMKSSAFAIGISMFCLLSGSGIVLMLQSMGMNWARYLIFANLDLAAIANGTSSFMYQTVGTALAVIAVHMVVFWLIAWDGFTRREI